MSGKKIRNMEDFAVAAGISRPTISKYFQDPSSVRTSTRQRIEEALARHNYQPNIFAVNLNRRNPRNIGVIVPHISDPFYAEIVRQIEISSLRQGYWAIVLSSHGEPDLEAKAIQMLQSLKLSGAIVAPLGYESDAGLIRELRQAMPLVFLDSRAAEDQPFVGTDNAQSISLMVEYLCRTGERPCFLEMPRVNRNATERRAAYERAMANLGFEAHVLSVESADWDFETVGFEETNKILARGGFPTRSVLCANDRLAFGVMAAAYQRGLKIGRSADADLRVAGHDDHPLSRYTCPALTTVAQDYSGLATTSLKRLLDMIGKSDEAPPKTEPAGPTLLEAKLIMRDSA
ncbi:LacI family transcriptional regulator [Afifella sp. H1R]|uniref:LacI family DNA-binding transcriptional regulator n=1 Tax=Afifella sp. H1R TaxID=2908841 RepID=UPI001F39193C|nr:LacI family DNA-binding transcriptional regulator [Afifella sp. H1R]MCF1503577.1 LacI family transcriptional regulator [Afifella sp. H1R]